MVGGFCGFINRDVTPLQPEYAPEPMEVTFSGKFSWPVISEHPLNALLPIVRRALDSFGETKRMQSRKALLPMLVTAFPIFTVVSRKQPAKAPFPMEMAFDPKLVVTKRSQSAKTLSPSVT